MASGSAGAQWAAFWGAVQAMGCQEATIVGSLAGAVYVVGTSLVAH